MNYGVQLLLRDKISRSGFIISILATAALLFILILKGNLGGSAVPLHYNVYFGIDLFGSGKTMLWYVAVTAGFLLANLVVAILIIERERTAARLLAWFAALTACTVAAGVLLVLVFRQ